MTIAPTCYTRPLAASGSTGSPSKLDELAQNAQDQVDRLEAMRPVLTKRAWTRLGLGLAGAALGLATVPVLGIGGLVLAGASIVVGGMFAMRDFGWAREAGERAEMQRSGVASLRGLADSVRAIEDEQQRKQAEQDMLAIASLIAAPTGPRIEERDGFLIVGGQRIRTRK